MTNLDFTPMRKGTPKLTDALERIGQAVVAHEMRDPFDIGEALTMLCMTGEPVTVYASGADVQMARIDKVDTENDTFVLDLADADAGLCSGKVIFVAALGSNAKVQFELERDWASLPGTPNLYFSAFPEACRVLNRRCEQRLETPVGGNYSARFTVLGRQLELPLYDFSSGGVGFRATPEQAMELHVGKKLENVELELGPSLEIVADLEVRLLRPFRTFLLGQQVQVGCRISNISMQMRQSLDRAIESARRRAR